MSEDNRDKALTANITPASGRWGYRIAKRLIDIIVASAAILVLSPFMVPLILLIMVDSPGAPLYRSRRYGRNGRPFGLLKLRTLRGDADEMAKRLGLGHQIGVGDPRLTKLGSFLRKSKLNEIPQFWNVLVGDISLVGPRPDVADHLEMVPAHQRSIILSVPQGIVDYATLRFHGMEDSDSEDLEKLHREYIRPEKTKLQLEYVRTCCLTVDLILLSKFCSLILGKLFNRAEPHDTPSVQGDSGGGAP